MGFIETGGSLPPGMTPKIVNGPGGGGGGGSFTTAPIRFLDSVSSFTRPAGNNRAFGMQWSPSGSNSGSLTYGDSFSPPYSNASVADMPQWHEDAPSAPGGASGAGTSNFEIAVLEVIDTPGDIPAVWNATNAVPVIGQYFNMGIAPLMKLNTLSSDPAGFERVFEMIFAIRRVSDSKDMAQALVKFTAIRS